MKSSQIIAIIVAVVAVVWIGSGILSADEPAPKEAVVEGDQDKEQKLMDVRVREIEAETYTDDIVITGRSRASKSVELKAETSGQIKELLKEEGDEIAQGDILAEIEVQDRAAREVEAQQKVNQRSIEYNAAKKLEKKGFNSKVRLAQSLAELEQAKAELKLAKVDLQKTEIIAPFEGIISEQAIEAGDYLAIGDPVFTIVNLDPIEFVGFVSERRIQELTLGKDARAQFLNGETISGKVTYIAPAADPQTRTFRVIISAPNESREIKEGLTAKIRVPVADKKAHKISPAILSLNDEGRVGVKIVNAQEKVEFVPVTILSDEPTSMWISGLPDKVRIITVGQEFVSEEQAVNAVLSDGNGLL